MKSKGFYVQSSIEVINVKDEDRQNERVTFIASMKPMVWKPNLGRLNAYPGECQDVRTEIGYRRCGVATELLTKCLKDDVVTKDGGILQRSTTGQPGNLANFQTSLNPGVKYGIWQDQRFVSLATEHCQTLIAMPCRPLGNQNSCKVYFEAAISAGYKNIFTDKHDQNNQSIRKSVMRTSSARTLFNEDRVIFLEERGSNWFFCKCIPGKEKKCDAMRLKDGFD